MIKERQEIYPSDTGCRGALIRKSGPGAVEKGAALKTSFAFTKYHTTCGTVCLSVAAYKHT